MSFIYYTQSKLVFGVGSQNQLEALLRENAATSILLIYSGDYVFDLGIHDVINQAARNIGANLIEKWRSLSPKPAYRPGSESN